MARVKICGLQRAEDIIFVNECKPDYVGFVFAHSRRRVTVWQAARLKEMLDTEIQAVGVFVNEEVSMVAELVHAGIIDMVQLHGKEDAAYIRQLRELAGAVPIVKAVRVASGEDVLRGEEREADYLLFDSFSPKEYGGTGNCFDWELIKGVRKPFFLAGGLNAANVEEALSITGAFAVDVSSAVETDGYKDKEKIREFIERVRNCHKGRDEE